MIKASILIVCLLKYQMNEVDFETGNILIEKEVIKIKVWQFYTFKFKVLIFYGCEDVKICSFILYLSQFYLKRIEIETCFKAFHLDIFAIISYIVQTKGLNKML